MPLEQPAASKEEERYSTVYEATTLTPSSELALELLSIVGVAVGSNYVEQTRVHLVAVG